MAAAKLKGGFTVSAKGQMVDADGREIPAEKLVLLDAETVASLTAKDSPLNDAEKRRLQGAVKPTKPAQPSDKK